MIKSLTRMKEIANDPIIFLCTTMRSISNQVVPVFDIVTQYLTRVQYVTMDSVRLDLDEASEQKQTRINRNKCDAFEANYLFVFVHVCSMASLALITQHY